MNKILLNILLLWSIQVFAVDVKIIGNNKTNDDVIKVELKDILIKKKVSKEDIKEAKRRIWNLRIFSEVKVSLKEKTLVIKVDERWTLLPIAKSSGGGGTSYYSIGSFDINALGTNTEVGAEYESLNSRPAGVIWLIKPQFLNNRNLRFGIEMWNINRVRYFYKRNSDKNGAFTLIRKRYYTFIEKRWDNDFYTLGFQYDYHKDKTSNFGISDTNKALNLQNNFSPNEHSINRWHTLYFRIGRLNFQNYLAEGASLTLRSSLISTSEKKTSNKSAHEFKFQFYKRFKNRHNFGWNFRLRGNNTEKIQYAQYMGGLSEVRGYKDGQFYSDTSWQNNIEYRFDLFEHKWAVLQGVIFSDQGKEGKTIKQLSESGDEMMLSSGFGVRFISPKIYSFIGRLDYAQTHTRVIQRGIAFGIQQFF